MVYVDPKDLGYEPYWQKWVSERMNMVEREELIKLFKKFVPGCIDLICEGIHEGRQTEKLKTIVPLTSLNMARHFVSFFILFCSKPYCSHKAQTVELWKSLENSGIFFSYIAAIFFLLCSLTRCLTPSHLKIRPYVAI